MDLALLLVASCKTTGCIPSSSTHYHHTITIPNLTTGIDVMSVHPSPVASRFYDKTHKMEMLDMVRACAHCGLRAGIDREEVKGGLSVRVCGETTSPPAPQPQTTTTTHHRSTLSACLHPHTHTTQVKKTAVAPDVLPSQIFSGIGRCHWYDQVSSDTEQATQPWACILFERAELEGHHAHMHYPLIHSHMLTHALQHNNARAPSPWSCAPALLL